MIPVLSDRAVCMCPHGGRLQFMVTHRMADGADGQVLTIPDYTSALIVGCALPPVAGGPCMKVAFAQDPLGRAMTVRGNPVVTQSVISFTDKGWPILVVSPAMSGVSIMYTPTLRTQRQADFALASVRMHQVGAPGGAAGATSSASGATDASSTGLGASGAGTQAVSAGAGPVARPGVEGLEAARSRTPWRDVIAAYWMSAFVRRGEAALLRGHTTGFGDGASATFLIYRFDPDGSHAFVTRLSASVHSNRVETEWVFEYEGDVDDLPDMVEGDEHYDPPEYFFELKVGGKTARSGLIEFVDTIHVDLDDETREAMADLDYVAYFADGTSRRGRFENGAATLVDIPPGKVHWRFLPHEKWIDSVAWVSVYAKRDQCVGMIGNTEGFVDGTPATFTIYRHSIESASMQENASGGASPVAHIQSEVIGNHVQAAWHFEYEGDVDDLPDAASPDDQPYEIPRYVFDLSVHDQTKRSDVIEFRDWVELEIVDKRTDAPLRHWSFTALLADGTTRRVTTDDRGIARLVDIPPGKVHVRPAT